MKIPWSLRLALYAAITVFMGSYYDSWSTTMGLLVRMGVYEDACTAEEIATAAASGAGLDQVKCAAQQAKIGSLLSVFRIAEFLTSMATGVFMDLIGTKICILTGMTLRILSWILLSNFPRINSLMILGCLLTGMSLNAIVFPVYTIGRYWLAYQDIAMCVVSVFLSVGCFYSLILNLLLDLMPSVNMGAFIAVKLAITHLPMLAMAAFIFPNNMVKDIEENLTDSMVAKNREKNVQEEADDDSSWNVKAFMTYVINSEVIVITGFFILNCVSLTFAQETFTQVYANNKTAERVNSILVPLSSLFSFIFMWVINKFGTGVVIFGLNIVSIAMHFCLLSSSTTASIFTSFCISVTFSGFITFFFIYVEKIVDIKYSGSIKGYLTTIAGLSLVVNPALNLLIETYNAMTGCQITFVVLRVLSIAPLFWLLKKEHSRMLKTDSSLEMTA